MVFAVFELNRLKPSLGQYLILSSISAFSQQNMAGKANLIQALG
jgi:predicted ATPase